MHDHDPIFGSAGAGAIVAVMLCAALAAVAGEADAAEVSGAAVASPAPAAAAAPSVAQLGNGGTDAAAGFQRCVDVDGHVTLTDAVCPSGSRVVNGDVSDDGAVGVIYNSGLDHVLGNAPQAELPRSRWADLPRAVVRKAAGTDAVTLQTARTTLLLRDEMRRHAGKLVSR